MRQSALPVAALVFAGWTAFMWATRIRNAFGDDDLSAGDRTLAVGVALAFTLGALAVVLAALRRRWLDLTVRVLAAATVVYWPVRVVQIVLADHGAAFTLVHAVLGVVSVALALWAWPGTGRVGMAGNPAGRCRKAGVRGLT
jgi:hypothetical protein